MYLYCILLLCILIDEDDLYDAQKALIPAVAKWKAIGTGLGIKRGRLDEIEAAHLGEPSECLAETLTTWLRKGYNVKRFGEPTWEKLVQVVSDPAAGSNPALALTVANKYLSVCKFYVRGSTQLQNRTFCLHSQFSLTQLVLHHLKAETKGQINLMKV